MNLFIFFWFFGEGFFDFFWFLGVFTCWQFAPFREIDNEGLCVARQKVLRVKREQMDVRSRALFGYGYCAGWFSIVALGFDEKHRSRLQSIGFDGSPLMRSSSRARQLSNGSICCLATIPIDKVESSTRFFCWCKQKTLANKQKTNNHCRYLYILPPSFLIFWIETEKHFFVNKKFWNWKNETFTIQKKMVRVIANWKKVRKRNVNEKKVKFDCPSFIVEIEQKS